MSAPTVLAIDSAGPVIGAALRLPDGRLELWSERVTRGADGRLGPAVAALLRDAPSVDLVAVSQGPGAFTSLRVGVAMALGVALARGCPVLGVSSLEARAYAARSRGHYGPVLALLDGRKERAYVGLFYAEREDTEQDLPPAEAIALAAHVDDFLATGEGAEVWADRVRAAGGRVDPLASGSPAAALAELAVGRLSAAEPPEALRLRYIRPPDAKLPNA